MAAPADGFGAVVETFGYPAGDATPGIKLVRGDGRITLVDCVDGGAGLLRVRSFTREEQFCFRIDGPGAFLALELQRTYNLRGDGEHNVEAEVLVNGIPRDEPVEVPTSTWVSLPVPTGQEGNTLVELRSLDDIPSGNAAAPDPLGFVTRVHVGRAADSGTACTAALVSPRWVTTAKSCLSTGGTPVTAGTPKQPVKVSIGRNDISGPGSGFVTSVTHVMPHPDRDIALMRLAATVNGVTPLRVASTAPAAGEVLQVGGYGRTADEWAPAVPHAAAFAVADMSGADLHVTGQTDGQVGPCQGDAGGPGWRQTDTGPEIVAVITAGGQGGCTGSNPDGPRGGTLTRVDDLRSWFDTTTATPTVSVALSVNSGQCLAISGGSLERGAAAVQWPCNGNVEQDWRPVARTNNQYEIRNDKTGMCLAVSGGNTTPGTAAVQWPCNPDNAEQAWTMDTDANRITRLTNARSGQCLGISGSSQERGAPALQWTCNPTNDDQMWQITPRPVGQHIRNDNSGLCLTTGGLPDNGARAVQQTCGTANDAEWHLNATGGGYAELRNDRSKACLGIRSGSTQPDADAIQWTCNSTNDDQKWLVDLNANGLTQLRNANSGQCLTVDNNATTTGAPLTQQPCNHTSKAQQWRL
ncbi:RICIN domain-containing protein [Jidongwangia harbinensis]|uniref:RICIN domain-containing protein n=1 Tax=Jidongwangia harbinensis TaxID=2878561 RepID=UPI001CD9A462|nr:RICIN domain-containing protein [Jidongwangia harbinensis]MCA2214140.1 RICIN domain-containing protein [Jidongwangia harbinensis]